MRFSAQVTTMSIAAMLLLCGCEHHGPQATMLTTAVSVSEAIQSEAKTSVTAETVSDTATSVATEPPAPLELIDGMLIYSQDFDDFADSTGGMPALEWDALSDSGTARLAIRDHRLYFENFQPQGKRYAATVRSLGDAIPEHLFDHPFTVEYDIFYTAGESGAVSGAADPADAVGLPDAAMQNALITVRLHWMPSEGYTVWQRTSAEGEFIKTGDPIPAAHRQIRIFFGAANGYLDNILVWVGHGESPDANVLCYWQAMAQHQRGGS